MLIIVNNFLSKRKFYGKSFLYYLPLICVLKSKNSLIRGGRLVCWAAGALLLSIKKKLGWALSIKKLARPPLFYLLTGGGRTSFFSVLSVIANSYTYICEDLIHGERKKKV